MRLLSNLTCLHHLGKLRCIGHRLHRWVWLRLELDILAFARGIDANKRAFVSNLVHIVRRTEYLQRKRPPRGEVSVRARSSRHVRAAAPRGQLAGRL